MHEASHSAVLARGIRIVAAIHHSHGVKAAAAIHHLRAQFAHWTHDFWMSALENARWFSEPVVNEPVHSIDRAVNGGRARVLLGRAVIPLAYTAVREWAAESGVESLLASYVDEACHDPGYLGHRLSVLLAFRDAWPLYQDGQDRQLFLDRFTEFVIASGFAQSSPTCASKQVSFAEAASVSVRRPGFFGHHVIALAWIARSRTSLTEAQFSSALAWVIESSSKHYEDAEDNVEISDAEANAAAGMNLESALQHLLSRGTSNIHLLTLADAISSLWPVVDEPTRPYLLALAQIFSARSDRT